VGEFEWPAKARRSTSQRSESATSKRIHEKGGVVPTVMRKRGVLKTSLWEVAWKKERIGKKKKKKKKKKNGLWVVERGPDTGKARLTRKRRSKRRCPKLETAQNGKKIESRDISLKNAKDPKCNGGGRDNSENQNCQPKKGSVMNSGKGEREGRLRKGPPTGNPRDFGGHKRKENRHELGKKTSCNRQQEGALFQALRLLRGGSTAVTRGKLHIEHGKHQEVRVFRGEERHKAFVRRFWAKDGLEKGRRTVGV